MLTLETATRMAKEYGVTFGHGLAYLVSQCNKTAHPLESFREYCYDAQEDAE